MKECYGKQDSNIAKDCPYDCEKCKLQKKCFNETWKRIRQILYDRYGE